MSHPSVHPLEVAPPFIIEPGDENAMGAEIPAGVRMRNSPGMPGTPTSLIIRLCQFLISIAAVSVMASTSDFIMVAAFSYFVVAVGLQSLWSFSLVSIHIYALLVGRQLRNFRIVSLFTIGDGIFCTLTFTAASAASGLAIIARSNMDDCAENQCGRLELAIALAFISWFPFIVLFFMNLWTTIKMKRL